MAKKKEIVQEEIEELEETELEDDDWDEDDDYEVDDSYEEAMRLEKEARKQLKEEAMKRAFQRDDTIGIRKNYNFLLGYGTFVRILFIVSAMIIGVSYLILAISEEEPLFLIPAIIFVIFLLLIGYLTEVFLKWLAYVLKTLHEINKKLK
ncbi:MAG: hypothetical protein HFH08_02385 [Bacilli bacterium]|nr:hypothetical protein [Bacilli bacterium]